MTIQEICKKSHKNAKKHGFYDNPQFNIMEKLALIHSEVSEAVEDYRNSKMKLKIKKSGKPIGFPSELADIVIRVGDLAGYLKINLDSVIKLKMKYNKSRPFMHGGKKA
jgi:NTP pyrophosphatase (non-canonical NTP hydrolase)